MNQINGDPDPPEKGTPPSAEGFRVWIRWFRLLIAVLVVAALAWMIYKSVSQFRQQPIRLSDIQPAWLVLALASYLGTMTLSWFYWHRLLIALGQKPSIGKSIQAFFISQLGKYVPGKAMVVVLRTDLVRDENVSLAPAAASVFMETLTWIFIGATLASLLLFVQFRDFPGLQVAAALMMIAAGIVTWPPVFNRLLNWIRRDRTSGMTYSVDFRTMVSGWFLLTAGWCLNALSLWLVLRGLPLVEIGYQDLPLMLAAVTLATVGGFVSLIPGGLGVREMVMIPLLGGRFGPTTAVLAALLIRLVWLSAELLASGIIYLWVRISHERQNTKHDTDR